MPGIDCATGEAIARTEAEELALRAALPIVADQVIAERARRLAGGFDYDFGDARGVHRIGTTKADKEGWDEVTTFAQAAMALGQANAAIVIKTDTGGAQISAEEWMQILIAAAVFRQPIWQASFALQAMLPIPSDYCDDGHWPAVG